MCNENRLPIIATHISILIGGIGFTTSFILTTILTI
jgi:hypothetical protein